jgi:hypothetical protein
MRTYGGTYMDNMAIDEPAHLSGTFMGNLTLGAESRVSGTVMGNVTARGDCTISGTVMGNVRASGDLTVKGIVQGDIDCEGQVTVSGTVQGKITGDVVGAPQDEFSWTPPGGEGLGELHERLANFTDSLRSEPAPARRGFAESLAAGFASIADGLASIFARPRPVRVPRTSDAASTWSSSTRSTMVSGGSTASVHTGSHLFEVIDGRLYIDRKLIDVKPKAGAGRNVSSSTVNGNSKISMHGYEITVHGTSVTVNGQKVAFD